MQRFVSGMYAAYPNNYAGRFFTRFLVEWLTQVVGWSVVDFSSAKWNNVLASGVGTADVLTADTLEIDSPSYAFSSADNNTSYLTITGFTGGNASRNGIYAIRRYVGSVGFTYTLQIFKTWGVHHEGLPIQSGLNWRLWQANDTYCPTLNTEYAVIGGKGNVGAGLANGMRSSVSLSITQDGSTSTLVDTGATFQDNDVGKSIMVTGSNIPGNNTISTIVSRVSPTTITFTNAAGGADSFTGSWNITYDFHVRIRAEAALLASYTGGFPGLIVAPWASWNNVSHTWNDNRYISERTLDPPATKPTGAFNRVAFWAEADTDHFTFAIYAFKYNDDDLYFFTYGVGELAPFYPAADPRPLWSWAGSENNGGIYAKSPRIPIIGTYSDQEGGGFTYRYHFNGLAEDDLSTVRYDATFLHCLPTQHSNMLYTNRRMLSSNSGKFYRIPIIAECRWNHRMEMRGTFKQMWAVNSGLPLLYEQGATGEYLHMMKGVLTPWNGAKCPHMFSGQTVYG